MIVPLSLSLRSDSAFFKQITNYPSTFDPPIMSVHADLYKFPESAAIIVPNCFRISKCFQNRITSENSIFYPSLSNSLWLATSTTVAATAETC